MKQIIIIIICLLLFYALQLVLYWKGNLKENQKKTITSRADQESRKNLSLNHGNDDT